MKDLIGVTVTTEDNYTKDASEKLGFIITKSDEKLFITVGPLCDNNNISKSLKSDRIDLETTNALFNLTQEQSGKYYLLKSAKKYNGIIQFLRRKDKNIKPKTKKFISRSESFLKKLDENSEAWKKIAGFYGAPELKGSDKQITWAIKIRADFLNSKELTDEQKASFFEKVTEASEASIWINNRKSIENNITSFFKRKLKALV